MSGRAAEEEVRALQRMVARGAGWVVGGTALAIAAYALGNALFYGAGEVESFVRLCAADRTCAAFVVGLGLFALFQAVLMRNVPCDRMPNPAVRFVPFAGVLAWLL